MERTIEKVKATAIRDIREEIKSLENFIAQTNTTRRSYKRADAKIEALEKAIEIIEVA